MYQLPYFKTNDRSEILQLIHQYPFATLLGSFTNGRPVATQIPILMEERGEELYLLGHVMKNTDHHRAFMENPQALALFTGPHTYVSSTWYSQPGIASTWNYMSVHAHGQINFLPAEKLIQLMRRLTLHFENNNPVSSALYDHLPEEFLNKMMPAIVGFEIKVDELKNVFKLSQNRDEKSYRHIIEQLNNKEEKGPSALIADEMHQRIEKLFPPGVHWDSGKFLS